MISLDSNCYVLFVVQRTLRGRIRMTSMRMIAIKMTSLFDLIDGDDANADDTLCNRNIKWLKREIRSWVNGDENVLKEWNTAAIGIHDVSWDQEQSCGWSRWMMMMMRRRNGWDDWKMGKSLGSLEAFKLDDFLSSLWTCSLTPTPSRIIMTSFVVHVIMRIECRAGNTDKMIMKSRNYHHHHHHHHHHPEGKLIKNRNCNNDGGDHVCCCVKNRPVFPKSCFNCCHTPKTCPALLLFISSLIFMKIMIVILLICFHEILPCKRRKLLLLPKICLPLVCVFLPCILDRMEIKLFIETYPSFRGYIKTKETDWDTNKFWQDQDGAAIHSIFYGNSQSN